MWRDSSTLARALTLRICTFALAMFLFAIAFAFFFIASDLFDIASPLVGPRIILSRTARALIWTKDLLRGRRRIDVASSRKNLPSGAYPHDRVAARSLRGGGGFPNP